MSVSRSSSAGFIEFAGKLVGASGLVTVNAPRNVGGAMPYCASPAKYGESISRWVRSMIIC